MNNREIIEFAKGINGLYSDDELTNMVELCRKSSRKGGYLVEVGILYGRTASILFHFAQEYGAIPIFIDPWVVNQADTYRSFADMVDKNFRYIPHILVSGTNHLAHNALDKEIRPWFVHIDGDHSPEGISFDIDKWFWLIPSGGIMCIHDYASKNPDGNWMFNGIRKAVDEKLRGNVNYTLVNEVDTQICFVRN